MCVCVCVCVVLSLYPGLAAVRHSRTVADTYTTLEHSVWKEASAVRL